MRLNRVLLVALSLAVVVAVSPEAQAAGVPITSCGQVVTSSAFLPGDMYCPGSHGIVVGAPGVTIDLKGFVLRGDRSPGYYGVYTGDDKVTVKNGVVRNFQFGLFHEGGDFFKVSNVVVSGSTANGIAVLGSSPSIQSSTASANGGDGIYVVSDSASITSSTASANGGSGIRVFSDSARIQSSTASGNGGNGIFVDGDFAWVRSSTASGNDSGIAIVGASASVISSIASGNHLTGIYVEGTSAQVKSSTASGNRAHGIFVFVGAAAQVTGNRAEANGFYDGADLGGFGIIVNGYATAPPVGTNLARGNDAPDECSPAFLC